MPGEVIEEKVTKEIIERDYFVILLSRNSLQSPWVCLETVVSRAKETCGNGFTVPVRVDDCLDDWNFSAGCAEQNQCRYCQIWISILNEAKSIQAITSLLI